ncbi:MAG: polysaccharide deacetylase family protein [Planctomycetota bacterium]
MSSGEPSQSTADVRRSNSPTVMVKTSDVCRAEKEYLLTWIFEEVFGVSLKIQWIQNRDTSTELSLIGESGFVSFQESFFPVADQHWLQPGTVPDLLDANGDFDPIGGDDHPPVFGSQSAETFQQVDSGWVEHNEDHLHLKADLFGPLFVILSRYDEACLDSFDPHGRIRSSDTFLGRHGLIDRAIGNEYLELIWSAIEFVWPNLPRKKRTYRIIPSHDIDFPSMFATLGWAQSFKRLAKRVIRERSFAATVDMIRCPLHQLIGNYSSDPFNQIDWLINQSERHGLCSTFFYIPEPTHDFDPNIQLTHPAVIDQWKQIADRGHELGMHPGYETFQSPDRMQTGIKNIRDQMTALNIEQDQLGSRQHFLRWRTPRTAQLLDSIGMDYDSSLGFAERVGFRCGVCYEFPMFDVEHRQALRLRQRPLLAMDASVIEASYMNLGLTDDGFNAFAAIASECRKYDGDFTLLWHNTKLQTSRQRDFYVSLLSL